MRTTMVLDAIEMARWSRGNTLRGLRCHSDAGSQFTSIRYGERLAEIGAVPSIGTVGDSYDNALAETVNGYYKAELIYGPARTGAVEDRRGRRAGHPRTGCTGTTPTACTATSATYRPQSSKPRSTLRNGPTNPWSKSNSPSLHQNQGDSTRKHRSSCGVQTLIEIDTCHMLMVSEPKRLAQIVVERSLIYA